MNNEIYVWETAYERGWTNAPVPSQESTRYIKADTIGSADNHDWYCGCGHWNGANLSICACCGRSPQ
jgi:hypothetical protein